MRVFTTLPQEDLRKVASAARAIEAEGYDGVASMENKHDPFLALAVAGAATERIELHTSVAIAFARTPMAVAQTGWDLAGATGGRFVVGLGSQVGPTTSGGFRCRGRRRRRACANMCRSCARSGIAGKPAKGRATRASTTVLR